MKRLFVSLLILAGLSVSLASKAQVYVSAHIGFGVPLRHVYITPPPPVIYNNEYSSDYDRGYGYGNNSVIVYGGHGYDRRRHRDYDNRYYRRGYERRGYDRDRYGWDHENRYEHRGRQHDRW
jgi:hypothetical protein